MAPSHVQRNHSWRQRHGGLQLRLVDAQSDQQFQNAWGASRFSTTTARSANPAGRRISGQHHFRERSGVQSTGRVIDVQNGTNGLQLRCSRRHFHRRLRHHNTQGLLNLAGGNYVLNGTVTDTNTWLNGGNFNQVGTNVINGALTWTAATGTRRMLPSPATARSSWRAAETTWTCKARM